MITSYLRNKKEFLRGMLATCNTLGFRFNVNQNQVLLLKKPLPHAYVRKDFSTEPHEAFFSAVSSCVRTNFEDEVTSKSSRETNFSQ